LGEFILDPAGLTGHKRGGSLRKGRGESLKLRARPVDDEQGRRFIRHALERLMAVKGFEKIHFIHGNPYIPWFSYG